MIANTLGFIEINLAQVLGDLDNNPKNNINYALIVILACLVLATVILLFVKSDKQLDEKSSNVPGGSKYQKLQPDENESVEKILDSI